MSDSISSKGMRAYLVDLINAKAGLTLDPETVTVDVPELVNPDVQDFSDPVLRNSRVSVSQAATSETPKVDITVTYNRLNLERMFRLRSTTFPLLDTDRLSDYVDLINERTDGALQVEDILDVTLEGGDATVLLEADPESLYVYGSVNLTLTAGDQPAPPDEDDDMHYIAYAPSIYQNVDGDGQQTTITISTDMGCGNPLRLISSAPESDEVLAVEDLRELVLEDSYVYTIGSHWQTQAMLFSTMDRALGGGYGSVTVMRAFYPEYSEGMTVFEEKYIIQEAAESYLVLAHPGDGGGFAFGGNSYICARLRFSHPQVTRPIYMYLVCQMPS